MISQLASYGVFWWFVFITVAFLAARFRRFWIIIVGHVLIAVVVAALDVQWIQAEMHRPGWDGQPDQDFIFVIGMIIRIVLVNTFLLPISVLGWFSRRDQGARPGA